MADFRYDILEYDDREKLQKRVNQILKHGGNIVGGHQFLIKKIKNDKNRYVNKTYFTQAVLINLNDTFELGEMPKIK